MKYFECESGRRVLMLKSFGVLRTHLNATLYVIPINATLSAIPHIQHQYQCVVVTGFGTSQHMMFLTY